MPYNLIVVGTSFASSFFLKKYLEKSSKDVRVLVLERGSFISHSTRTERSRDKPFGTVGFVSGGHAPSTFKNANPDKPWIFDPSFGGSSNCWTGCTPRFMPGDFKLRSAHNTGEDWPLTYDDLEPYYCEAEEIMAISGPGLTPYPMSKPYPQPPHQLSSVDRLMQQRYEGLYISQPTARSSITGKRNKCCSSAICHQCPVQAKFTIENGLMHLYKDPRVNVSFNSQVLRLETTSDLVKEVVYTKNGAELKVAGDSVALGANAIFNAHILLNSGDKNPATGRYLSEQVGFYCYVYLDGMENEGGSSIITSNGYMLYETVDRSKMAACIMENHNDFFVRHEHGKWRQLAKFKFVFEDIPQYHNRVTVSDDPAKPLVNFQSHSDYVDRGYKHLRSQLEEIFSPLPVERIALDENTVLTEAHNLGTTRMSDSASSGVIDKHLVHHQYRNLFVLGGSSFPAISPANPTLTIAALSLWSADKKFSHEQA